MTEDSNKGLRDQVIRGLFSAIKSTTVEESGADLRTAKDIVGSLASWAGKGKDEIVGVICREIGVAVAAMLKEPLTQVLENRQLRISIELVEKSEKPTTKLTSVPTKKKRKSKKKS